MGQGEPRLSFRPLFLDIETSPIVAYTWGTRNQDLSIEQIIKPHSVLCVGYALGDRPVEVLAATTPDKFERMIGRTHELLHSCDAVVHFNGDSFDMPRLNAEFLKLGLLPPPPTPQIDLKKTVMKRFGFTSSRLAFLGPELKIGEKVKNDGWPLWDGCLHGDKPSWLKMVAYNTQDVELLRRLYRKVLPWIDNHPNLNLYVTGLNTPICTNCGSTQVEKRGIQRGATLSYHRLKCLSPKCGRWFRMRCADKQLPSAAAR